MQKWSTEFLEKIVMSKKGARVFVVGVIMSLVAGCSDSDGIIAEVNGKPVYASEFQAYLELKRIPIDDEKKKARQKQDYLEREALASMIEQGDYVSKEMAKAEVNEFRKQMLISRHFETYLAEKVSDEAISNYYAANKNEFQSKQIRVAHILVRTNSAMSKEERQARLTKAREIYSKLRESGDFSELAAQYSEDTISAKQGGSLGWIKRGDIDPVFSERVFSMKAGDISEPFSTPFGYHIVQVEEDEKTVEEPFNKVKGDIRYRLRQAAKDAEMERLLSEVEIEE
ncbi:peptidylprolyl isomerase [uncultured Alcanivorax sp.]|jgi:peptidyl-prolyl cis-trans isomerase C|uniref:peptidylprolyl isomerase n=1 Tax=uncultured Alcanivorax sp. TaxID=191215 RepID=UPI0030DAF7CF